ncbi:MAG: iron-containing alcohol dehydrogenase [Verrucomicrobia bacterium]|nr:iron-containing alcohol dehydrogenase [Verrucomicrobiota bacterium]
MLPFDYQPRTRMVFGAGTLSRLGQLVRDLGGTRVLVVTDPGIVAAGHAGRAMDLILAEGLECALYNGVRENPDALDVERCLEAARAARIDLFVGLGGGSAMDTAKGANFILTNGGVIADYKGIGKAHKPMLPLIAVPTTAGTGSECQSFALISDPETHMKMACGDPKAAAKIALLDPELTLSQPPHVSACTGIDALVHALETAVTKKRSPISQLFSREAFRLCVQALPQVLSQPGDVEARGRMLLGAAYAGVAIENSMLGCTHAAANPLTARYGVVHGLAVGLLAPGVLRRNALDAEVAAEYLALARHAGLGSIELLREQFTVLLSIAGLPRRLSTFGVNAGALPELAREAAAQWTASFNPVSYSLADFENLYREVLE